MTQGPTVTKERTGNKGDLPQHREPKPTRHNPPSAVLPPTPPGPSGLKKSKEINPKERGRKLKENKEIPDSQTHKCKGTQQRAAAQPAQTKQPTTKRSPGYPRAKQEETTVLDRFVPHRQTPNTQTRPTKPTPTIVEHLRPTEVPTSRTPDNLRDKR